MILFKIFNSIYNFRLLALGLIIWTLPLDSLKSQNIVYKTNNGRIRLFSTANVNIDAINKKVKTLLNIHNGDLAFSLELLNFKPNNNAQKVDFLYSSQGEKVYPNITFKGNIGDIDNMDFSISNSQNTKIKGDLTIHGITKHVELNGKIIKFNKKYQLLSNFIITLNEFDIDIPKEISEKDIKTIQFEGLFDLYPKD